MALGFGRRIDKLEGDVRSLKEIVRQQTDRLDEHEDRIRDLEGIEQTLDELGGYGQMTRDELLRVQGILQVHEQTIESLLQWATTEDNLERVKSLRFRFRHHKTRSRTALVAQDE